MKLQAATRLLIRPVLGILPLAAVALCCVSCATKAKTRNAQASQPSQTSQPYCHYTAVSRIPRSKLPPRIFFFPPLLADSKGNPKQQLTQVKDAEGGISDWACPSTQSKLLRTQLEGCFRNLGYQIVTFADVLAMRVPHSILIVSSTYSAPQTVNEPKEGKPDRFVMTKLKANTFDVDLDPGKSRHLATVDGVSFYRSDQKMNSIESKSFAVLCNWLGDNLSGLQLLDP